MLNPISLRLPAIFGTCFVAVLTLPWVSADSGASVSFERDVEPVLRANCLGCHQGAKKHGEYLMTDFAAMLRGGESGEPAIVPGKPDESSLVAQITPHDGVAEMPKPPSKPLHASEIETIRKWITEGAIDDRKHTDSPPWDAANPPVYAAPPTIASLDSSPDGRWVAAAGFHELVLLDANTGEIAKRLIGMSSRIDAVAFSPDGARLAAVGGIPGESGELQIWKVESGELLLSQSITHDTLSGVSWSPDGKLIAFGATDNVVRAIQSETGEQVVYQGAHEDWVRDTVFTPDGTHIVSVGRDMSCKLTEVATERFIDNITSITPGALSGGLSSVVMHPVRNEIVVGGADGVVKVYRVFRETERRIGDDANLVRRMPAMTGRVSEVAISTNGQWIAACSTLDRKSEVRVWKYNFSGEVTAEMKAITAKQEKDRTPEENAKLNEARDMKVEQTIALQIDSIAIHSITVDDAGAVFFAADDGHVHQLAADGSSVKKMPIAVWDQVDESTQPAFSVKPWLAAMPAIPEPTRVLPEGIVSIAVHPESVHLKSPYQYVQFIVTATLSDGSAIDVTDVAQVIAPETLAIQPGGLIRPLQDGQGNVEIRVGNQVKTIPFAAEKINEVAVDFVRDVNPVLSRLGCNQGTCHGAQKGKNGFRLSLRGYDPIFDLRALTDDLAARRINPAAPADSLMLRKPLGTTPHEGGVLMTGADPYHAVLRQWIADGSRLDLKTPRVARIEIVPSQPVVQAIGGTQRVRVVAHYVDGTERDVTREAFIESGNTEIAVTAPTDRPTLADSVRGQLIAVRRGEAPILARYEGAYAATTMTVMGDRPGYVKQEWPTWNAIDQLVAAKWDRMKIVPSDLCDDATFLRRVHLDLTGLPPSSDAVRKFLADPAESQAKRMAVIDSLIGNPDFVEFWTNKWADLLQVNRKFLEVDGSKAYRGWIRTAVEQNRPYDQFAREILTATGSNQTNPPASYFKVLRTAEEAMENTTHLFLGIRFNCNKCHDHPFERWTQDQYHELAAYFANVNRVRDPASGDRKVGGSAVENPTPLFEIIGDDAKTEVLHARTGQPVAPALPYALVTREQPPTETLTAAVDEKPADAPEKPADAPETAAVEKTRRVVLAEWLTHRDNPYFARSYVNRLWAYLTGVGLIEPIDDLRAGNPATNPELLDHLTNQFIESGFDTRLVLKQICSSRTYSLAIQTNPLNEDDSQNYSHATPRRLPAEVIYDAVHLITGATSQLPGMPAGTRAAAASDAGVELADGFLQNLGRPVRETACECERADDLQLGPVMALISGPTIGSAISDPKNALERLVRELPDDRAVAEELFMRALGRLPTETELAAVASVTEQIQSDHVELETALATSEAEWTLRRPKLEAERMAALEAVTQSIVATTEELKPQRDELERKRTEAIAEATKNYDAGKAKIPELATKFLTDHASTVEWHPLAPMAITGKKTGSTFVVRSDRSILASGEANNGFYEIDFETTLDRLTGLRIEALTDPSLPSNGPGRAANFVVTEVEILAGADKKTLAARKFSDAKADFLQAGFDVKLAIDGQNGNQNGWAVAGANGHEHWATFTLAEPIAKAENTTKTHLRIRIHQNHPAAQHLLGRFRISVTTSPQVDLGLSETFASAARKEPLRDPAAVAAVAAYIETVDGELNNLRAALQAANQPVPQDPKITELLATQEKLKVETPLDPQLEQLRKNFAQSQSQIKNARLTAAEDLTWALINTPAFLFNR